MKNKKKLYVAVLSFVFALNSIPAVIPHFPAEAVPAGETVTIDRLQTMRNIILNSSETSASDAGYDLNGDGRIDSFDMCLLRKKYVDQQEKYGNFYSLSSELVHKTDAKYGMSVMSEDFYSKRIIVKAKKNYSFENYSPTNVISGPEHIYVVQFDTVEKAEVCMSALRRDSNIEYVELDEYINCEEPATSVKSVGIETSWGVKAIEADKYAEHLSDNYNSDVVVAVVDTGVSAHSFIGDRLLNTGYDLVDNDPDPNDKHYHGTHVAGTVVDCTPNLNINIMPVRVLDENGSGSTLNVGNGIRYATESGADVINLSLGGYGCSKYIDDSIEYAVENGVTVVVAAGNNSNNTTYYCPSHIDDCIVVSACDSENNKANFSNYGDSVDVTAPGVDIISCIPGGSFRSLNGTSMATPHISASVAMIKYENPQATPAEIEQTLKDISLDLGDPGKDVYYGYGLPKLSKLIESNVVDSGKCGDDVYYTFDENGLLTISGTGTMTNWYDVVSNYAPWYEYKENIKKVVIEDGVTNIGDDAFHNCDNLTSITIPNSVTIIGYGAFSQCNSLISVTIPDSVIRIVMEAFYQCSSLTSITISNSVKSIGKSAFSSCSGLTSVNIPDSVTSIGESAFSDCSGLTSITISNSVKSIGKLAFSNCSNLTSVTIPDSVTNIGEYAFVSCSGLTSINISDNVTSIENWTFHGCSALTSINIPDSVTSIGYYAFYGCKRLEAIKILNPECEIDDASTTITNDLTNSFNGIIYGYTGSTAQAYAEKYDRTFIALD